MSNLFEKLLQQKQVLLADGATGTNLFEMGLQSGDAPELWNLDHPDRVAAHYRSFIEAGSDLVLTNTFGGSAFRLKLHQAQNQVDEINIAATEILKAEIAASGREVINAGSIGPTGELLAPLGAMQPQEAIAAFAQQALALKQGGADVLWIETMSSPEEVELAITGAAESELPIVFTMSFDTNGRTMMGIGAADLIQLHQTIEPRAHACGTNCGVGASEVVAAILNLKSASNPELDPVLIAKANCGIPEFIDGKIRYNGTPDIMARYAVMARDAGARIIGGCCGTTPTHIAAMRKALDEIPASEAPSLEDISRVLGDISKGAQAQARGEHKVVSRRSDRQKRSSY